MNNKFFTLFLEHLALEKVAFNELKELADLFKQKKMYSEYIHSLEYIYFVYGDNSYLPEAAELYLEKFNTPFPAYSIYSLLNNKEKIKEIKNKYNQEFPLLKLDNKYCTNYAIFIYILNYFFYKKKYNKLMDLYKKYSSHFEKDNKLAAEFSYLLSQSDNNELNKLAIEIYNQNIPAWFNILDNLITNNDIERAFALYNQMFINTVKEFKPAADLREFYWALSDLAKFSQQWFKQVKYQVRALEYE